MNVALLVDQTQACKYIVHYQARRLLVNGSSCFVNQALQCPSVHLLHLNEGIANRVKDL